MRQQVNYNLYHNMMSLFQLMKNISLPLVIHLLSEFKIDKYTLDFVKNSTICFMCLWRRVFSKHTQNLNWF